MGQIRDVSVVLNVYKRSDSFRLQLDSLLKQTVKPNEILVWENGTESVPEDLRSKLKIARATENFGVWARFAYSLNAVSEYVCVIDDDTIPGENWLSNCIETINKTPGLLGTRGLIFDTPHNYAINREYGVYGHSDTTQEVDIVGHSWFFKRSWLGAYWAEYGNRFNDPLAGEDIHFSFALQKHLSLPTLVPPHPESDLSMWGSNPETSRKLGSQNQGISQSLGSMKVFENALQHYRSLGFRVISEKSSGSATTTKRYPWIVYWVSRNFPKQVHLLSQLKIVRRLFGLER
jgi:glycosyltransferase involved in cell wall biosynthesis